MYPGSWLADRAPERLIEGSFHPQAAAGTGLLLGNGTALISPLTISLPAAAQHPVGHVLYPLRSVRVRSCPELSICHGSPMAPGSRTRLPTPSSFTSAAAARTMTFLLGHFWKNPSDRTSFFHASDERSSPWKLRLTVCSHV